MPSCCAFRYPDTQPQDYDRTTWLAGLGSRLSARPANFSAELAGFAALLDAARAQLVAEAGARVRSELNRDRVRNATALVRETLESCAELILARMGIVAAVGSNAV